MEIMEPAKEKNTALVATVKTSGVDSFSHLLTIPKASSTDVSMFALAENRFGRDTAKALATWLNWEI